jgi:hypothetical protein
MFTSNGKLRQQFYKGTDKGSGAFGHELGAGSFVIICGGDGALDDSCIQEKFCGRGVGTGALKGLLQDEAFDVRAPVFESTPRATELFPFYYSGMRFHYAWPVPRKAPATAPFQPLEIDEGELKRLVKFFQRVGLDYPSVPVRVYINSL